MRFTRASGILLHPTSLPSTTGIGELGKEAFAFVDFLASAGQTLWQVLPLGPTGYGDSPYACYSAFAGNPLLISLQKLVDQKLLSADDLVEGEAFSTAAVDFDAVTAFKDKLLRKAFQAFRIQDTPEVHQAFRSWCDSPLQRLWLEDYALFMAIKRNQEGKALLEWPWPLRTRQPDAIGHAAHVLAEEVWFQRFQQWLFDVHWQELVAYAHSKGIQLVGDIPIYVSDDSADVWAHPELFDLDEAGNKRVVAGVPPDYFSETGQLWGNPLYRWDMMARTGYRWWIERFRVLFSKVDRVRLDHFRGFEAYWEIPAGEKTAVKGRWVKGPDVRIFEAIRHHLGDLPIIAEDLGIITPEVEAMRDRFSFPGMKILQFAFGGESNNPYLPHNYDRNCVVYTGTHDNDTTCGWFDAAAPELQAEVRAYVGASEGPVAWPLIRLAMASSADLAIFPLQDVLELGTGARMNTPSVTEGNWKWRYAAGDLTEAHASKLKSLAEQFGRFPRKKEKEKAV